MKKRILVAYLPLTALLMGALQVQAMEKPSLTFEQKRQEKLRLLQEKNLGQKPKEETKELPQPITSAGIAEQIRQEKMRQLAERNLGKETKEETKKLELPTTSLSSTGKTQQEKMQLLRERSQQQEPKEETKKLEQPTTSLSSTGKTQQEKMQLLRERSQQQEPKEEIKKLEQPTTSTGTRIPTEQEKKRLLQERNIQRKKQKEEEEKQNVKKLSSDLVGPLKDKLTQVIRMRKDPSGKIATLSTDGNIEIWDTASGTLLAEGYVGTPEEIYTFEFSDDGNTFTTESTAGKSVISA